MADEAESKKGTAPYWKQFLQRIDKVDALPSEVCKQSFDGKHPFAVKWHFQADQPGNAHFTAAN
jgi:hypothetical protein